jgi:hypothetical protein
MAFTVREKPPLRLYQTAIAPSGRRHRWGADEPNPENVPSGQRFSTTMPGGFETHDAVLPRKPGVDYSDLEELTTIEIRGAGRELAGEYRLERAPQVSGDQMAISPSAVGWQANLEDDKAIRALYIFASLSEWGAMSLQRRADLLDASPAWTIFDGNVAQDLNVPAILTTVSGAWPDHAVAEALLRTPGVDIGAIYYEFLATSGITPADANWNWSVNATDNDQHTGAVGTGDLSTASTGSGYYTVADEGKQAALLQLIYSAAGGADGVASEIQWRNVTVYGRHGITRRGDDPGGLYASDIVRHAVTTFAPHLVVNDDSIQPSTFIVPHAAFLDPTSAGEIVRQVSRFGLPDWGVWGGREFVWHARNARGRRWRARIRPSQLEQTGPQVDRIWESIVVSYQDVDGSTRTVGPPGSGADTESDLLKDTDTDNPANRLGIVRRDLLQAQTNTPAGAIAIGQRFLQESKLLDTSGRARLVGHVEDDCGVLHPAWKPRAGDQIAFVDAADKSYRRIVRTDYSHDDRSCTLDLDAPPEGLQALLERLGVVLIPLGL